MKKIFVLSGLILLLATGVAFAKSDKNTLPVIKFDKAKYTLLYSANSKETGGYINEYYKANQTYASWTDLIGVHHYPTAFYPTEHAKEFAEYLNETGVPANIEIDEENNSALLYFLIIDKTRLPILVEFNVFKYEKSPVCGTVGLQYAKRYRLNSPLEIEKARRSIIQSGLKYIKKLSKTTIPEVITLDMENGKYSFKEGCNNNMQNME